MKVLYPLLLALLLPATAHGTPDPDKCKTLGMATYDQPDKRAREEYWNCLQLVGERERAAMRRTEENAGHYPSGHSAP